MKTIGSRIKDLRISNNITLEELSKKLRFSSKSTSARIESDQYKISYDILSNLSKIFDVSIAYLVGEELSVESFNITGSVSAGFSKEPIIEYSIDSIDIPLSWLKNKPKAEFMLLKITGDSMFPDFKENDICLIHIQDYYDFSGQIVVCMYDDNYASIKELRTTNDKIELIPYNRNYPVKTFLASRMNDIKILGVLWKVIRDI